MADRFGYNHDGNDAHVTDPDASTVTGALATSEAERHAERLWQIVQVQVVLGVCALVWLCVRMARAGPQTKWVAADHPEALAALRDGTVLATTTHTTVADADALAPRNTTAHRRAVNAAPDPDTDVPTPATVELVDDKDDGDDAKAAPQQAADVAAPPKLPPRPRRTKKTD